MKGNLIDYGILNDCNPKFDEQLTEFTMPEEIDYDPDFANPSEIVITAKREFDDKKYFVESITDGKITIYLKKEK